MDSANDSASKRLNFQNAELQRTVERLEAIIAERDQQIWQQSEINARAIIALTIQDQ